MTYIKKCPRCKCWKSKGEYNSNRAQPDGLQVYCRKCFQEMRKKRPPVFGVLGIGGKRCSKCEKFKPVGEFYRERESWCIACIREKYQQTYAKYKETHRKASERWRNTESGKERLKENSRNFINKHYAESEQFRKMHLIRTRLGGAIRYYLTTGNIRVSQTGDIDFEAIIKKLGPIPEGYHYGRPLNVKSISVDHIAPLALFDLTNPVEYKAACSPANVRWMISEINTARGKYMDDSVMEDLKQELIKKVKEGE